MQISPDLNSNSRRHNSKWNDFLSVNRVDTTVQSTFLVCFHNQLISWFIVDHWIWERISSKRWWFSLLSVLCIHLRTFVLIDRFGLLPLDKMIKRLDKASASSIKCVDKKILRSSLIERIHRLNNKISLFHRLQISLKFEREMGRKALFDFDRSSTKEGQTPFSSSQRQLNKFSVDLRSKNKLFIGRHSVFVLLVICIFGQNVQWRDVSWSKTAKWRRSNVDEIDVFHFNFRIKIKQKRFSSDHKGTKNVHSLDKCSLPLLFIFFFVDFLLKIVRV